MQGQGHFGRANDSKLLLPQKWWAHGVLKQEPAAALQLHFLPRHPHRGKLFQLTVLVAELGRLLNQQLKTQAQLPQLQPSLCTKAMMLHREVMPKFSQASCGMWLKSCASFMRGMRQEVLAALQNQDLAATIPDPYELWRCSLDDNKTEFEKIRIWTIF